MSIKMIMPVVAFGALLAISTAYAADPTAAQPASGAMSGSSMQDQSGTANSDASTMEKHPKHIHHHSHSHVHHHSHHHKGSHRHKGDKGDAAKTDGSNAGDATSSSNSSMPGDSSNMPSSAGTVPAQ